MNILDIIKKRTVYFDGATGTVLQRKGLMPGEMPELWNITHKQDIIDLHTEYMNAGADIIKTNTFGLNPMKFDDKSGYSYEELIKAAINNAKEAKKQVQGEHYIAFDMGPSGKLLKPLGDLDFEDAVELFAKQVRVAKNEGADLVLIETMNDSYETKAAVIAAKENCELPVFVTNAYDMSKKLMTGADAKAMIAMLEGLGVDAIGMNCSMGPDMMRDIAKIYLKYSSLPVIVNPNAGLPKVRDGKTVFDITKEEFCSIMCDMVNDGVRLVGGCCGTDPSYIKLLKEKTDGIKIKEITKKEDTLISSYTHSVKIGDKPVLIGERINPTGKKRFKQALIEKDFDYILKEAIEQEEKGVDVLDVNVGLPEIDEAQILMQTVFKLQEVTDLPLQIDTANTSAMEKAMRIYNGKALINSVNGKKESMDSIFPLVKKYGGVVIALTLDENGIPKTAEGRIRIFEKILNEAKKYGIDKKDIVVDPLAMTISSDTSSANVTLETLRILKEKYGINTSLGVSNISFGLPVRDFITSTFFALSLSCGLSCAIMNPYSQEMMKIYYSYMALTDRDERCEKYIEFAEGAEVVKIEKNTAVGTNGEKTDIKTLKGSIIKGLKDQAGKITSEMLFKEDAMDIINNEIIPALDTVGKGFEEKRVYLPQLLMSAEAAKASFDVIKEKLSKTDKKPEKKCTVIIATVKGDIHDIGKNIVKVLLENYGFDLIDLGKDVDPSVIIETIKKTRAPLLGLSALMTTTVPSMQRTIELMKKETPWCRAVVGGAVLTKDYAEMIGADMYAKDAMETVRFAEKINSSLK